MVRWGCIARGSTLVGAVIEGFPEEVVVLLRSEGKVGGEQMKRGGKSVSGSSIC